MSLNIRVLLAEDHPLVRDSIALLLSKHRTVVGSVERGDAVLMAIDELHPDAVIMDISMPGRSGLQVLPELRSLYPQLVVVLLTNHDSAIYRQAATARGADGYVLKQNAASDLWRTLEIAISNRMFMKNLHAAG